MYVKISFRLNNGYLYVNYLSKYYYCACSEYSRTDGIYTTEYVNYSLMLLFVREVNLKKINLNIITAHAESIHVLVEFT